MASAEGASGGGWSDQQENGDPKRPPKSPHETVVNMLSMLSLGVGEAPERMLLLNMAHTPESCLTLRRAGCIPLLVELIHPPGGAEGAQPPEIIQIRAARALKNIVQFNPDEKEKKKELRVLRLLEGIRLFTEAVKGILKKEERTGAEQIQHPTTSLGALTKLSFDEEHRVTMCLLGTVHALADLVVADHQIHGNEPSTTKEDCLTLRRLTGKALTNLTVYDKTNKALLCGMREFLFCLVRQLDCGNEEICQISASVLRNLSWKVDSASKAALSDVAACSKLMLAAMQAEKETTLKANLGAIWNLSQQSHKNMVDISTASKDALPFLLSLMKPNSPILQGMKNPGTIIEHASGILKTVSSHLRNSPELKKVLRDHHCYEILLDHLKSPSMMVVANACGTLCSLSGGTDCEEDQRKLLDLNAIPMLKSLVYSKDQRISQGSSTALRNLLASKFAKEYSLHLDSRLSAQIYNSPHDTQQQQSAGKSSGSESEEMEPLELTQSKRTPVPATRYLPPQLEPPAAHQQSTSSAASLFHPQHCQFSNANPGRADLSLPLRRPATAPYYGDSEPLDLSLTSSKSSPIHFISAAEFGSHNGRRVASASSAGRRGGRGSNKGHELNGQQEEEETWRFPYSNSSFNRSCPEILSRYPQQTSSEHSGPLDFSSSSPCGVGEEPASDTSAGDTDTTFNYSLRFAENEEEGRGEGNKDTVKTYCYEGTPQTFSKSNSCQDLVQELDYERETHDSSFGKPSGKLQPIDEVKPYYVEDTPAAFSRASSLSSIHSNDDPGGSGGSGEERKKEAEGNGNAIAPVIVPAPRTSLTTQIPPQPLPRKRLSQSNTPCRVTFSAEETPLMFSRSSSVASLDSLGLDGNAGDGPVPGRQVEDDLLSEYSRGVSEAVSPSEIPDSPRALTPPPPKRPINESLANETRNGTREEEEDAVRVFSVPEKSGFNSCRSLSPLMVDGEEIPVLGRAIDQGHEQSSETTTVQQPTQEEPVVGTTGKRPGFPDDELKVFAIEGTPFYGVSTATSLSDLMADIEEEPAMQQKTETSNVVTNGNKDEEKENQGGKTEEKDKAKGVVATEKESEDTYSDAALLEKCIRVGKAIGIPKSQSEFKISKKPQPGKLESSKQNNTSKSQDFELDDPDLAALIQIGRNRTTDKDNKGLGKGKGGKKGSKSNAKSDKKSEVVTTPKDVVKGGKPEPEPQQKSVPRLEEIHATERNSNEEISESSHSKTSEGTDNSKSLEHTEPVFDPNQVSTMSLGSEWNDETPTFSSPIPSMSISTAFKMVGSHLGDSLRLDQKAQQKLTGSMSVSTNHELIENVEPPSTFSNLVSSTDCISPRTNLADRVNKRWKVAIDNLDNTDHSRLTDQKPPPDFDMENSMISVASIKSEIFETSDSLPDEVFQSAAEDLHRGEDNTYTIFPPENANRLSGVKSTDMSDGRTTVVSEDLTDAEDLEEYETAPLDESSTEIKEASPLPPATCPPPKGSPNKPLMEVHPLKDEKYNTFVVKKSTPSPRNSPRQKRREDPERYKTRTISPFNKGFTADANGNPDLKYATFRVGGPKLVKAQSNMNDSGSLSPASSPGQSPKAVRGRRKPLYSSLPPSAIIKGGLNNKDKDKDHPPPIPPKPTRTASPGVGAFVRQNRATELRLAKATKEKETRESSPRRPDSSRNSSKTNSNSSLNQIPAIARPKVAPKPPTRTTPSMSSTNIKIPESVPIHIRTSSSAFGLSQGQSDGLKGYSTLPKSTKLGSALTPFSLDRYSSGESKESIPGSEKSGRSGFSKISNLWKKMEFRKDDKAEKGTNNKPPSTTEKKGKSKLSSLFGRGKEKQQQQQPFREPLPFTADPASGGSSVPFPVASAPGVKVRGEGGNKVIQVQPFNYTPPLPTEGTANGRPSKITTV